MPAFPLSLNNWQPHHWSEAITHWGEAVEHQVCGGVLCGRDLTNAVTAAIAANRWDVISRILHHQPRPDQLDTVRAVARAGDAAGLERLWETWSSPLLTQGEAWASAFQRTLNVPTLDTPAEARALTAVAARHLSHESWSATVNFALGDLLDDLASTGHRLESHTWARDVVEDHWEWVRLDDGSSLRLFGHLLRGVSPAWLMPAIARHPRLSLEDPAALAKLAQAAAAALNVNVLEMLVPHLRPALNRQELPPTALGEVLSLACRQLNVSEPDRITFVQRLLILAGDQIPRAAIHEAYRTCEGAEERQVRALLRPRVAFGQLIPPSRERFFRSPAGLSTLDQMMVHAPAHVQQHWLDKTGPAALPMTAQQHRAHVRHVDADIRRPTAQRTRSARP